MEPPMLWPMMTMVEYWKAGSLARCLTTSMVSWTSCSALRRGFSTSSLELPSEGMSGEWVTSSEVECDEAGELLDFLGETGEGHGGVACAVEAEEDGAVLLAGDVERGSLRG